MSESTRFFFLLIAEAHLWIFANLLLVIILKKRNFIWLRNVETTHNLFFSLLPITSGHTAITLFDMGGGYDNPSKCF